MDSNSTIPTSNRPSSTHLPELTEPSESLYQRLLGEDWPHVALCVRRLHESGVHAEHQGRFRVTHGESWIARLIARRMKLPPENAECPVLLTISKTGVGERWERRFCNQSLVSTQSVDAQGRMVEQFGKVVMRFRIVREGAGIRYLHAGSGISVGRFTLPVPLWLGPQVHAVEEESVGGKAALIRVEIRMPIGLIGSYEGEVAPLEDGGCR